jgi:hypothetical protein
MTALVNSRYNPARGGHAPGDVRDSFLAWLEAYYHAKGTDPVPTAELREQEIKPAKLFGLLWNCTDVLPRVYATMMEELVDKQVGSYAHAARALKPIVVKEGGHE